MEKFIRRGIALVCTIMMVSNPLLVYAEENSELKMEDAVDLESESNELDEEIQQNPEMEEVQETDSLDQSTTVTEEETEEIFPFSAFGSALAHNRVLGKALCLKVCGVKGFFRCAALATVFQPISGIDVIVWCGISSFNGINHFRKNRIHRYSPSLSS